jgi:hypothetical protein
MFRKEQERKKRTAVISIAIITVVVITISLVVTITLFLHLPSHPIFILMTTVTSQPYPSSPACPRPSRYKNWRVLLEHCYYYYYYYYYYWFQTFAVFWILYVFFWVFPPRQIVICRRFGTLCQFHLQRLGVKYWVLSTLHPAFEDGTDRGFRNVGKSKSDAGEIPKRIHTIIIMFKWVNLPSPHYPALFSR